MWQYKHFDELTARKFHDIVHERMKIFVIEQDCAYLEVDGVDLNATHVFKEEDGDIKAYARVYSEDNHMSFGRVLVPEKVRGAGGGRELVEKVMEFLHEQFPDKEVIIAAEAYLEDFYESFGFKTISKPYLDYDIWHVQMKLSK